MIIRGLEVWPVAMPYRQAFASSRGTTNKGLSVILRLHTDTELQGLGEASLIFPDQSGEDQASIVETLVEEFAPLLIGRDPRAIEAILDDLRRLGPGPFGRLYAACAVDHALFDLIGKHLDTPVHCLLGGAFRDSVAVSRSLSVQSPEDLVRDALEKQSAGYPMLTLKGSSDPQGDVRRFLAVREALGPDYPLEIDPNQAWSADEALEVVARLAPHGLVTLEQPCPWDDLDAMARVTSASPVTIAADESVLSPADALRVVERRAAHMITIKLACSGGIHWARRKVAIAEAGGLRCNMGSKHTLGVGTAAIVHFAAAMPAIQDPIGYGSPLERFADDVIRERIPFHRGRVHLPEGPGLGVSLDEARLARYSDGVCRVVGDVD